LSGCSLFVAERLNGLRTLLRVSRLFALPGWHILRVKELEDE
jgi:hypothetical protein